MTKMLITSLEKSMPPLVCVVDDDQSMREALQSLFKSIGFRTEVFASANEFLSAGERDETDCLILDIRMPDVSGLELQQKLKLAGAYIPIVFITAHGEANERQQALENGAIDFLYKPFSEDSLLGAVRAGINKKTH